MYVAYCTNCQSEVKVTQRTCDPFGNAVDAAQAHVNENPGHRVIVGRYHDGIERDIWGRVKPKDSQVTLWNKVKALNQSLLKDRHEQFFLDCEEIPPRLCLAVVHNPDCCVIEVLSPRLGTRDLEKWIEAFEQGWKTGREVLR